VKRKLFALASAFVLAACGASSPSPSAANEPPAGAAPTAPPAPSAAPSAPSESATPAAPASREAREKHVIELLEGRVPQPDLPTDSGGG
jgi:uncharacterized lipoprotein YajG